MPVRNRISNRGLEKIGQKAQESEASGNFSLAAHLYEQRAIVLQSSGRKEDAAKDFRSAAKNANSAAVSVNNETYIRTKQRCESAAAELEEEVRTEKQQKAHEERVANEQRVMAEHQRFQDGLRRDAEKARREGEERRQKSLQASIAQGEAYVKRASPRTKIGAAVVASFSLLDVYLAGKTGLAHYAELVASSSAALISAAYTSLKAYLIYDSKERIRNLKNSLKWGEGSTEARIADNERFAKKSSLFAKISAGAAVALSLLDLHLINKGGIVHYLDAVLTSAAALASVAYAAFATYLAFDSKRLVSALRKQLEDKKTDA